MAELNKLEEVMLKFRTDNLALNRLVKILGMEMDAAVAVGGSVNSVKMLPTFVRGLPDGTETGSFLALDLGGTKFKVLLVTLTNVDFYKASEDFNISDTLKCGTGVALFNYIAEGIASFVRSAGLAGQKLALGFTFSFPCDQISLTSSRLIHWTKGFHCSNVEGQNVVELLQQALDRCRDIEVRVAAILNDTVGTLMAAAHLDERCKIGAVIGTGVNACFLENLAKCPKLARHELPNFDKMVINMELGAFGDNGSIDFVLNEYDNLVDAASINPGQQRFEKATSGMYLGELVRLILCDLHHHGVIFNDQKAGNLHVKDKFLTKFVSSIEQDNLNHSTEYLKTRKVMTNLGISNVSQADCEIIGKINTLVAKRSANLCAAALVAVIKRMNLPLVTIGCEGSLYKLHPSYKILLESKIEDLLETHKNSVFTLLKLAEDGSAYGAALVAAIASRTST